MTLKIIIRKFRTLKRILFTAKKNALTVIHVPTETAEGFCHVCGNNAIFTSYEPVEALCKRNSFICNACGSSARNRHIAKTVLELFPEHLQAKSLTEFSKTYTGTIFLACASGALFEALKSAQGLVASEYIADVPSGQFSNGIFCQDIQQTSFADNSFDFVITEDVLEHVPFPEKAFNEIKRILKPGGYHVSTIPVKWELAESRPRVIIENGEIRHLLEPEYHLDPMCPTGILAYTDYGQDIVERYCGIIGESQMLVAHGDKLLEKKFAIYNNWIFLSRKLAS